MEISKTNSSGSVETTPEPDSISFVEKPITSLQELQDWLKSIGVIDPIVTYNEDTRDITISFTEPTNRLITDENGIPPFIITIPTTQSGEIPQK